MDDNNLQISITAVDEASSTLDEVASTVEGMATSIDKAGDSISETFDTVFADVEAAALKTATSAANAWIDSVEEIATSTEQAATAINEGFDSMASGSAMAIRSAVMTEEESLASLNAMMNGTEEEAAAAWAAMGGEAEASATKATNAMSGMHSYFRLLIAGYLADTAGKGLIGMVNDAVTAAAGDPQKLAQDQAQLAQMRAELQKAEIPISGKGKTTAELGAAEQEQAAKVQMLKEKIAELQQQMQPLITAQQIAGQTAKDYDDAAKNLTRDWQTFLVTVGAPMLENIAQTAIHLDDVVKQVTAFAEAHPKLTETILLSTAAIGLLLVGLGGLLIAVAPLIILFGMMGVALTAINAAVAIAFAAIAVAAVVLVSAIIVNWGTVSKATKQAWDDIAGFVQAHWQAILNILMPGMGTLIDFLFTHWDTIKKDVKSAWDWIESYIGGIWSTIVSNAQSAIGQVQKLLNGLMTPVNALTSSISNIGSMIGNAGSSMLSVVPHFADGGIVSSPTLALVGEAGPEAIIPLSAFNGGGTLAGAGGGSSGSINIILSGNNFYGSDSQMSRRIANDLRDMINQQIKLRQH